MKNALLNTLKSSAIALLTLLLPCSLLADPIVVRINDIGNGPPEIQVDGAPNGFDFCTCVGSIVDPSVEKGGIITLFGVDTYGSINEPYECGWRFLDPSFPTGTPHVATDIIWIQHDYSGPFFNGDLQIAFDSALPGHYYSNTAGCDVSLGPLTYKWQLVYADDTVVVLFKSQKPKK